MDYAGVALIVAATFTGISTLITAVGGAFLLFQQNRNHQATLSVGAGVAEVKTNVVALEASTNGKMDRLLAVTAESAFAKGAKSERDKAAGGP